MSISVQRYEALKRQLEQAVKNSERAEGALAQIRRDLKAEFGCKSEEEAEQLLKRMQRELEKDERELEVKVAEIEKEFGDDAD